MCAKHPPPQEAALQFARTVVHQRGWVGDDDIARLRRVRYGDGEIAEIVANVAVNLFSNYFDHVARTDVDFPSVPALGAMHTETKGRSAAANGDGELDGDGQCC